jgi:hypothetical protein
VQSTGGSVALRTNDLGYFWFPVQTYYGDQGNVGTVTFPAATGVQNGATTTTMCAKAATGNCSSCHDGVTTAPIF